MQAMFRPKEKVKSHWIKENILKVVSKATVFSHICQL